MVSPVLRPAASSCRGRSPLLRSIRMEAALGLAPQPSRVDVLAEKRRRPVLVLAEAFVEDLGDVEAGVEPDEVGGRERAHRGGGAEVHGGGGVPRSGGALLARGTGIRPQVG